MTASPNDIALRQQIYLEGVKNHEIIKGNEVAGAFISVLTSSLSTVGVENLYEFTKKQFNSFIVMLRRKLLATATKYKGFTERVLKNIAKTDYSVTKAVFMYMSEADVQIPKTKVSSLWARIQNDRVSGIGDLPKDAVNSYFAGVVAYSIQLVQKNYSDKGSLSALLRAIKGTPSLNYRDGAANRFYRQFAAMLETLIQHGSSVIDQMLGRLVSDRYIWLSVLDGHTTAICRSRNGHIYRYGEGPQPPAHYRCRSKTRPYFAVEPTMPNTFFAWISSQPRAFLDDVLGGATARKLLAGKIPPASMSKYENALRISPEQYKDKVSLILA